MFSAEFCSYHKNYQNVFLDNSSNKSLWLFGKFVNLIGSSNDCSESDVLEFVFGIFILDENDMISVEDDSVAFLFSKLKFELPSVDPDVFVWNKKLGTFGLWEDISKGLQEEFLDFEWFLVGISDFQIVFILKFENQWACRAWKVSGFGFEEELEFIHHWVKREVFRHVLKRVNKYFIKKLWCLNFKISN